MSFGFAVDTAECSCAKRRTDCSRLLDPAAIGVALEVAEEFESHPQTEGAFVHADK
jgi:hypothetical protein